MIRRPPSAVPSHSQRAGDLDPERHFKDGRVEETRRPALLEGARTGGGEEGQAMMPMFSARRSCRG